MEKNKAYVAMSGGVDSSVSAALLLERGYEVVGVFIKTWSPDWLPCTWREERRDAMRVAAHLNIPLFTLDLSEGYKRDVADYMISEYKRGRTPNPDVSCNKFVKFGGFYNWALEAGASLVATGHYAQVKVDKLFEGKDSAKDQSYFLWTLNKEQLQNIKFPVGELEKSEVRKLAEKFNLPVANKRDSQGVCFLGAIDMKEFLKHYIDVSEGDVLSESGEVIGKHDGALLYTLGERHGFTITNKTPNDKPYYIVARDTERNTITVSENKLTSASAETEYKLENINWISEPQGNMQARVRYHGKLHDCSVSGDTVTFDEPVVVASGQSIVFYSGDECLGGAVVR